MLANSITFNVTVTKIQHSDQNIIIIIYINKNFFKKTLKIPSKYFIMIIFCQLYVPYIVFYIYKNSFNAAIITKPTDTYNNNNNNNRKNTTRNYTE